MNNIKTDGAATPKPGARKTPPSHIEPKNALWSFFKDGYLNAEKATSLMPFATFLMLLGLLYIANSHYAEQTIRKIDKLSKEVKELGWEYKSLKAELMYKSKMTELEKRVDTIGLHVLVEPPKKIVVYKDEH